MRRSPGRQFGGRARRTSTLPERTAARNATLEAGRRHGASYLASEHGRLHNVWRESLHVDGGYHVAGGCAAGRETS